MLGCFYGQPKPFPVLPELGWTSFPFCWCSHLFLLPKTTFRLSLFLTSGQVWLKEKKNSRDISSLRIFQTQTRELPVLCAGISCRQDKRHQSRQEYHGSTEEIEVAAVCLLASSLPFRSESLLFLFLLKGSNILKNSHNYNSIYFFKVDV